MSLPLVSHVNRDDDLIEAWLRHYLGQGVTSFHLILHGGPDENRTVLALRDRYPIEIVDQYTGAFDVFEKRERLTRALARLRGGWVVLVDSDEFVEWPYRDIARTRRMLEWLRADALSAPMLQRFSPDGAVDVATAACPFAAYEWCSTDLYAQLGQPQAVIDKYPLFLLTRRTALRSGGNHYPPNGFGSRVAPMLGVTHHFKWRASVRTRLDERAHSAHPYRGESVQYLSYLEQTGWRLPVAGAFRYSRRELFRRGLLARPRLRDIATRRAHVVDVKGGKDRVFAYMMTPDAVASRVAAAGHTAVAVCGAGSGGRLFVDALERRDIAVTHVTDRDARQWGSVVHGAPVVSLDVALAAGVRVFVTGSLSFGAEMARAVFDAAAARHVDVTVFSTDTLEDGVR